MPRVIYEWRDGFPSRGVPAAKAGGAIENIRRTHLGEISPEVVVEEAREPRHILHPLFQWHDTEAAAAFRLIQARNLIGALTVKVTLAARTEPRDMRAFVSVPAQSEKCDRRVYVRVQDAMSDPEQSEYVIGRALIELRGWQRRWKDYTALAAKKNRGEIKQLVSEVTEVIDRRAQT